MSNYQLVNPLTDELLERLANYFIYFEVLQTRGLEFHEFVELVLNKRWENFV